MNKNNVNERDREILNTQYLAWKTPSNKGLKTMGPTLWPLP